MQDNRCTIHLSIIYSGFHIKSKSMVTLLRVQPLPVNTYNGWINTVLASVSVTSLCAHVGLEELCCFGTVGTLVSLICICWAGAMFLCRY